MRLFVAIDLPEEVKKMVADIRGNLAEARWVPVNQIHLTLRFIGEVDEAQFQEIKSALTQVKGSSFPLALKGVGHFPPGKHPRVLWVGLEINELLTELHQRVELALADAGIAPEERRFSPHITIARLKESPAGAVAAFEERHAPFRAGPFPVAEFYLYSSTLTREGAIHTREATYPFTGGR